MNRLWPVSPSDPTPGVKWALDTETENGKAILVTLAGPDKSAYVEFPGGLSEIFLFLADHSRIFMAYNMDYDARAIIKFLPKNLWKALYRDESVTWRGFKVSYRPSSTFTITKGTRTVTVYDAASHFQTSLDQATIKVLGRKIKRKIPKAWYKKMAAVLRSPRTRKKLIAYGLADAEALRDLWKELNRQYIDLGIPAEALNSPFSPGSIASRYFGEKLRFSVSWDSNAAARRAYAGGRIEVYRRGHFPKVWIYDLKSAYPDALSRLHDPRDLEPVWDDCFRDDAVYSIFKVRVNIPLDTPIPPIPAWAPGKTLRIYPVGRWTTWLTGPEVKVLERRGWVEEVFSGIHLVGPKKKWLTEIPTLFQERTKRPGLSQAIKLVLNSVYGKLAEQDGRYVDSVAIGAGARQIGNRWVRKEKSFGSTTNFFVAAYITALTRLQLWSVMNVHHHNMILAATDAVMLDRPLSRFFNPQIGSGLGQWELSAAGVPAVVVGTGVYAVKLDGEWKDKMRGYKLTKPLVKCLKRDATRIRLTSRVAWTLGDFATREGIELNKIVDVPRTLDVNFDSKRIWPEEWKRARHLLSHSQTSRAPVLLEESNG